MAEIPPMAAMMFQKMVFPLELLFIVCDFIFYRPFFEEFLLIRMLCIPTWMLMNYGFKKARTSNQIQTTVWLAVVAISFGVNVMIWRADQIGWGYYPGLLLVITASLSFLPFTLPYRISAVIAMTAPYYIGFIYSHPNDLSMLGLNSFFIFSTFAVGYFGNQFYEMLRVRELLARMALADEVKSRDQQIVEKTKEAIDLEFKVREAKILSDVARHVSHDIRSPISAMNLVIGSLKELPDAKRTLLTEAVKRVNDIANDLLTKSREMNKVSSTHSIAPVKIGELHACVDDILKEKRIQYQDEEIDFLVTQEAQRGIVEVRLEPVKFKRIISNLLNNSIEALDGDGRIEISLSQTSSHLVVQIKDNGRGIPMDVLPKLMTEGFTHGKSNGNGLGLFTARRDIESWGGNITLMSSVESGTTVSIRLPLS